MNHYLVAVDPGKAVGGMAVFLHDKLVFMDLVDASAYSEHTQAYKFAEDVAARVEQLLVDHRAGDTVYRITLVCEDQVIDSRTPNANSLLWLSKTVGALEYAFAWEAAATRRIMPQDWKGSIADSKVRGRMADIISRDKNESRVLETFLARKMPAKDKLHPQAAVGIGLFALGRAGRALVNL